MFWDTVAGVYDIFVNVINRKTHQKLRQITAELIGSEDEVLECACGTGLLTSVIAAKCKSLTAPDSRPPLSSPFENDSFCRSFRPECTERMDKACLRKYYYPDGKGQ